MHVSDRERCLVDVQKRPRGEVGFKHRSAGFHEGELESVANRRDVAQENLRKKAAKTCALGEKDSTAHHASMHEKLAHANQLVHSIFGFRDIRREEVKHVGTKVCLTEDNGYISFDGFLDNHLGCAV